MHNLGNILFRIGRSVVKIPAIAQFQYQVYHAHLLLGGIDVKDLVGLDNVRMIHGAQNGNFILQFLQKLGRNAVQQNRFERVDMGVVAILASATQRLFLLLGKPATQRTAERRNDDVAWRPTLVRMTMHVNSTNIPGNCLGRELGHLDTNSQQQGRRILPFLGKAFSFRNSVRSTETCFCGLFNLFSYKLHH